MEISGIRVCLFTLFVQSLLQLNITFSSGSRYGVMQMDTAVKC